MTGKNSISKQFSVINEEYKNRWDAIFGRDLKAIEDQKNEDDAFRYIQNQSVMDNTGTDKDEFYDVLVTEDALMVVYKDNIS
jgi:hypothetical protein